MANVIILYWRDIPAQVIAEQGRGRGRKQSKFELDKKFSIAIDAAAMKSGADGSAAEGADAATPPPLLDKLVATIFAIDNPAPIFVCDIFFNNDA